METERQRPLLHRREVFKVAGAATAAAITLTVATPAAQAQTNSDIEALNLVLNMEYLLAQFISAGTAEAVPLDRLTGNGVAGMPVRAGRAVTFVDPVLRSAVLEMAADNRNHLIPLRAVIGALASSQPLIDISVGAAAPFSVAMQRAGVVAPGAVFDPYANEENFLYALFFLKNISVATYRGMTSTISNRVVVQNFSGLLGTEAIHLTTIRSYLYTRGATTPKFRENADRIVAFQNSLNGGGIFQGLSPANRSTPAVTGSIRVANITPALANGQVGGRSGAQALNQLYLAAAEATSGGFYPNGVNGTIRTSASA